MTKIILSDELDVHSVIKEYKMCSKYTHDNIIKVLGIYSNAPIPPLPTQDNLNKPS